MSTSRPVARLRHPRGNVELYEDALVEKRNWRKDKPYPLEGLEAKVDGAGMQMRGITFGNTGYLTITGPGVAITRELNGRGKIRQGVEFAAQVEAAQKQRVIG